MDLDGVKKIESADFYIDLAFRHATKEANDVRSAKLKGTREEKSKKIEITKIMAISDTISSAMMKLIQSYPDLDGMTEFYKKLFRVFIDMKQMKLSLGGLNWLREKIVLFGNDYIKKIRRCEDLPAINRYRKEYYGRASSLIHRIESDLKFLEEARKTMRQFPSIKSMFTVCIAGFPNVGKSTLLAKMTSAKPEIKNYAFTTKGLNTGYLKKAYLKIQFIDTPGTLNRADKMNVVEVQADLALKYCADLIVYVFDPTETYSYKDQVKLLETIKKLGKDILIYVSKTDIAKEEAVDHFLDSRRKIPVYLEIEDLQKELLKICRKNL
ncbi:GTP-binding protein [Candidatus Woesearchaeota archaeon]|jgi:nucleolar GTP-binding protein|nr:GTP-binding protein [Candidatus Woesearchaeota archaeon]MBT3537669.1 GTP-binding protein [Candidatus Woesearchaeota archaeon]MBT4698255.1 GTP-binding protein [Candidatus Woesearchaeota archaeon]MBT4717017.1 GTP-binding protein [Candidatus Woesearchaeota archaeon]MBT7105338.1 GTP-binding protein [Candidatus Woesearchaeota archaeon]